MQGITYNWNVRKLVFLKLTISTIRQYETAVDICIITNEPDKAREVLHKWQFLSTRVCEFDSKVEDEQYALVWKHREVFDKALSSGEGCCTCICCQRQAVQPRHSCHAATLYPAANTLLTDSPRQLPAPDAGYSMFMYLEDDTDVPWVAIKSWALDSAVLEPLGFMRGLVRTEFHPNDGVTALLDVVQPLNVSEWQRTVHVSVPKSRRCRVTNSDARYWLLKEVRQRMERQRLVPATVS